MSNRKAKRPLDPKAVEAANAAVAVHTKGRKLTMKSEDYKYRQMWMDAYIAAGGKVDENNKAKKPLNKPVVQPCPKPLGEVLKAMPKLDELPEKVAIPKDLCKKMQSATDKSIDKSGNSNEHGGTIAIDKNGKYTLVKEGAGKSGTFTPDTSVPADHTYKGTFHTHPYGKNDGSFAGAKVPFSGGDIGTMDDYKEDVSIVQSGDKKYVVVRTKETPANIDDAKANAAWQKSYDAEYKKQKKAGKSSKEAFEIACAQATKDVANKYKLGYYEGTDCNSLSRVNP